MKQFRFRLINRKCLTTSVKANADEYAAFSLPFNVLLVNVINFLYSKVMSIYQ